MSVLPDIVLRAALIRGIDLFRRDGSYARELFRSLQQDEQERAVKYCEKLQLQITAAGVPRPGQLTLPCAVMLLRGETETHGFLGDMLGSDVPDEHGFEGGIDGAVTEGTGSTAGSSGLGKQVWPDNEDVYSASAGGATYLDVASAVWYAEQWTGGHYLVLIEAGTGRGQTRDIASNTSARLNVSLGWTTIPDATSRFTIRVGEDAEDALIGSAQPLYDRRAAVVHERIGYVLRSTYHVVLVETEPWRLLVLTALAKAAILAHRLTFEREGLHALRVAATDIVPVQLLLPAEAFARSLVVDFSNEFAITREMENILSGDLGLSLYDASANQLVDPVQVEIQVGVQSPAVLP